MNVKVTSILKNTQVWYLLALLFFKCEEYYMFSHRHRKWKSL